MPLLGRAGSRREWLVLIPVSAYAMVGMCVAAWSLAEAAFPGRHGARGNSLLGMR